MDSSSINLTDSAIKRIQSLLPSSETNNFRVYVTGGGCSGFQYGFKFDGSPEGDDDIIPFKISQYCSTLCLIRIFLDLH